MKQLRETAIDLIVAAAAFVIVVLLAWLLFEGRK
jgi:hypothetical protein